MKADPSDESQSLTLMHTECTNCILTKDKKKEIDSKLGQFQTEISWIERKLRLVESGAFKALVAALNPAYVAMRPTSSGSGLQRKHKSPNQKTKMKSHLRITNTTQPRSPNKVFKSAALKTSCYICNCSTGASTTRLVQSLEFTKTVLFEVLGKKN